MNNDRTSYKYIVNVNNYDVSSYGHSVHHYVCEGCNKPAIEDIPKTTLFKTEEEYRGKRKRNKTEKED